MSKQLTLHELTLSPNNVKVRIALGYKKLPYERRRLEFDTFPGDRSSLVSVSRQPRTPVLQHGETVIFDSGSILRYLEANFRDAPRIFRDDYAEHGEIEQWEQFARTQIGESIRMLFSQAFAPEIDPAVIAKANRSLNERTGALEDKLNSGDFLVGDHLTAADIACAAPLYLADMPDRFAKFSPIAAFFHKNTDLGAGREKTRAWARRVVAYDPTVARD